MIGRPDYAELRCRPTSGDADWSGDCGRKEPVVVNVRGVNSDQVIISTGKPSAIDKSNRRCRSMPAPRRRKDNSSVFIRVAALHTSLGVIHSHESCSL